MHGSSVSQLPRDSEASSVQDAEKRLQGQIHFRRLLDVVTSNEAQAAALEHHELKAPEAHGQRGGQVLRVTIPESSVTRGLTASSAEGLSMSKARPSGEGAEDLKLKDLQNEIDMLRTSQAARASIAAQRNDMLKSVHKSLEPGGLGIDDTPAHQSPLENGDQQLFTELGYLMQERDLLLKEKSALQKLLNSASDEIRVLVAAEQRHIEELRSWVKERDQLLKERGALQETASLTEVLRIKLDELDLQHRNDKSAWEEQVKHLLNAKALLNEHSAELQTKLDTSKGKEEALSNQVKELTAAQHSMAEQATANKDVTSLKDEKIRKLHAEIARMQEERLRLESKCDDLMKDKESALQEANNLRRAAIEFRDEKQRQLEARMATEAECESLKISLVKEQEVAKESTRKHNEELQSLAKKLEQLEKELDETKGRNHHLESSLQSKATQISRFEHEIMTKNEDNRKLVADASGLEEQVERLKSRLAEESRLRLVAQDRVQMILQENTTNRRMVANLTSERENLLRNLRNLTAEKEGWTSHQAFLLEQIMSASTSAKTSSPGQAADQGRAATNQAYLGEHPGAQDPSRFDTEAYSAAHFGPLKTFNVEHRSVNFGHEPIDLCGQESFRRNTTRVMADGSCQNSRAVAEELGSSTDLQDQIKILKALVERCEIGTGAGPEGVELLLNTQRILLSLVNHMQKNDRPAFEQGQLTEMLSLAWRAIALQTPGAPAAQHLSPADQDRLLEDCVAMITMIQANTTPHRR